MNRLPGVTVITVVLNGRRSIRMAIESVLGQNYPYLEYIVKDGGSTDGTQGIVKEYADYLTLVSEPDRNMYEGLNQALRLAGGDIIALLGADDFYTSPEAILHMVRTMEETEADVGWGDAISVDRKHPKRIIRRVKSSPYGPGKFKRGWHPPHPAFFVRRSVYERYGTFRRDLGGAADYELMLRFLERFKVQTCYLPETIVAMRSGGGGSAFVRFWRNRALDARAWKVNSLRGGWFVSWLKFLRKAPQWFRG